MGLYRARSQSLNRIPSIMGRRVGDSRDMIGFVFWKESFDHRMDSVFREQRGRQKIS